MLANAIEEMDVMRLPYRSLPSIELKMQKEKEKYFTNNVAADMKESPENM